MDNGVLCCIPTFAQVKYLDSSSTTKNNYLNASKHSPNKTEKTLGTGLLSIGRELQIIMIMTEGHMKMPTLISSDL